MSAEAAIPLLAALLWAVYQMLTRMASRTDRPETSLLYAGLAGAVVLSLAGPFYWLPRPPGTGPCWGWWPRSAPPPISR